MWKVVPEDAYPEPGVEDILGLIMTYVDDMFLVAMQKVLQEMIKRIRSLWATTEPEMVGQRPSPILGHGCHENR